jgi:hypothetical protein
MELTYQKLKKIFELMDDLGIQIEYINGEFRITDTKQESQIENLRLLDRDTYSTDIQTLPPLYEYKLEIF